MNVRLLALLVATTVAASAADVPAVIAPAARGAGLTRAKTLLAPREATAPADLKDPFYSEAFATAAANAGTANPATGGLAASSGGGPGAKNAAVTRPAGPRSARDLVEAIATGLKPSGSLVLRGEPVLLFGQKRVKAGDALTITFEGTEYTVVITAIKAPNFTFRLNNEEFTRPIK